MMLLASCATPLTKSAIRSTSRIARSTIANQLQLSSSSSSVRTCTSSQQSQYLQPVFSSCQVQKRSFQSSARAQHGGIERPEPGKGIRVTFRDSKGNDIKTVEVNEGDDLLSIAHEYDIDLEGACEGSIACSTCHVILDPEIYDKLEEPGDDENDMLDLAFGLTDT